MTRVGAAIPPRDWASFMSRMAAAQPAYPAAGVASRPARIVSATSGRTRRKGSLKKRERAASAIAATPSSSTVRRRASQTWGSMAGEAQATTRALTRSGASSASVIAIIPPSDSPQTAAVGIAAASRTANASSARVSRS